MDSTDQPPRSAGADGAGTASTSETATTQRADADERSQVASAPERPVGVVGIGASAGGIEAVSRLLAHTPIDTGLAFVVVIHLSPDHESQLAELLQRHTEMPVEQVRDDVTGLAPNAVYVIPPGRNLTSVDSHLRLSELEPAPLKRAPIDHFFRTLAATNDGASIGVVLSGTGSDGAMGLQSIKERGGLTVVQEPAQAEYDGMPRMALATGMVDLVLKVEEMPRACRSGSASTSARRACCGPTSPRPSTPRSSRAWCARTGSSSRSRRRGRSTTCARCALASTTSARRA
jgi:chemotaxis response regulator CheB